jgi:hypothetical protein
MIGQIPFPFFMSLQNQNAKEDASRTFSGSGVKYGNKNIS